MSNPDPDTLYSRNASRVVIVGMARNVAGFLPGVLKNIMKLVSFFADFQIIVFENDSSDRTRDILQEWSVQMPDHVHIITRPLSKVRYRTHRLAIARNTVLDLAHSLFPDFDYLIALDFDDVNALHPVNLSTIQFALDHADEWDAISFMHRCEFVCVLFVFVCAFLVSLESVLSMPLIPSCYFLPICLCCFSF